MSDELKKRIEAIFESSAHQADVLIGIYKLFIPGWDSIKVVHNWPSCGKELWLFICRQFMDFDKEHHPDVMNGGLWMNKGFSCNEKMSGWDVDVSTCNIERG